MIKLEEIRTGNFFEYGPVRSYEVDKEIKRLQDENPRINLEIMTVEAPKARTGMENCQGQYMVYYRRAKEKSHTS